MSDKKIERRAFLWSSGMAVTGLSFLPEQDASGQNTSPGNDISRAGFPDTSELPSPNAQDKKGGVTRRLPVVRQTADLIVVGGGLAGTCAAITAARAGLKVLLVQDRPVLGGNASSEVRLWVLGATAHMGNNNRWSREGGVHEEIIVENMFRNKEGNPIFFDALLLEKVWAEPNITLMLNTSVDGLEMKSPDKIGKVFAYCSQNETRYELSSPFYCDTSGDGILGYLAGAAFRVGAETSEEFGEPFVMPEDYGRLLGHSMYFYSKDAGRPIKYVAPTFALKDIPGKVPRYKNIQRDSSGCPLWWFEWGDELDRVFDSEKIKEELWRVVYGAWDYIKNSGAFENVDNLTLEWVNLIPGKRESRRFEGDYILKQQDIGQQNHFDDAVAYGGWAIDLHPAKGVYSSYPGCTQYHTKGVYTIPYRSIYSRNITNLFMGGRLVSVTHAAFGSTRVISTGTLCAQAAALGVVLCLRHGISPREVYTNGHLPELQRELIQSGQFIPGVRLSQPADLVASAVVTPTATLELAELSPDEDSWRLIEFDCGMLFPLPKGKPPVFSFTINAKEATTLNAEFCICSRFGSYTPDVVLDKKSISLAAGTQKIELVFDTVLEKAQYGFVVLKKNPLVTVPQSEMRISGVVAVFGRGTQQKHEKFGFDEIPMFTPGRRPLGKNLAMRINPPLKSFGVEQLQSGIFRPASGASNVWAAPLQDETATLKTQWDSKQTIHRVVLWFDTDFDHSMESCQMGHPESVIPFCIQKFQLLDDQGHIVYETKENHHSRCEFSFKNPLQTSSLTLVLHKSTKHVPISLFGIQAFEK